MKQKLNKELTLYKTNFFPKSYKNNQKNNKKYKYEITLGIGGNIGNTIKIFHKLFLALKSNAHYNLIQSTPILKNPPFGYIEQNYFYNSIIVLQTNEAPKKVLRSMQRYENRFKRKRFFQDAPRTLDIDILFIKHKNHLIESTDSKLILPHPGWNKRKSVLIPLTYL